MARLTIYLPDSVETKVREAAYAKGQSVSQWIAGEVIQSLDDAWPKAVLDAAGALPNLPNLKKTFPSDVETINRNAARLNREAVDTLEYQKGSRRVQKKSLRAEQGISQVKK
jgi:hypothetical protein